MVEQSEELRDLEAKLKAAYMNKERDVQILEAAKLVEQQRTDEARVAEEMEKDRQRGLKAEAYRAYLRTQDGVLMRQELDTQMVEKEQRKKLAYEEFLKEKSMVDEVVEPSSPRTPPRSTRARRRRRRSAPTSPTSSRRRRR